VAWLAVTWKAGEPAGEIPGWLASRMQLGERDAEPITPSLVVTALRDLGLAALTKAIRAMPDRGAGMLSVITIAGCGVELDVHLPSGTPTGEILARQPKFAENLLRHAHEVHLTIPKAARTIRVWIADAGALDEPIGPSPLTYDEDVAADYYTGRAPWGQNLRGDTALVSLKQRHVLIRV
jgi:S-DNA-T family DNA segregation ATPase FtsK/SpoIIIE